METIMEDGSDGLRSPAAIRKFNPGTLQSDMEVIGQFVVRKHELRTVLESLKSNLDSPSCQHVLVVAPRGRGKTMLVARTAAALRTEEDLSSRLLPVRFMEESHEIFDLADFWLETLFFLAKETTRRDPGMALELDAAHKELSTGSSGDLLEQRARVAVLDAAHRMGKKLVLMIENLQSLNAAVDIDFGWKLREILQTEPQIMLLTTATNRFEGLDDPNQPFFEIFRVVNLAPLTTRECRTLWQSVSEDQVSKRSIRPLEILTGGNPRLLVIIAEFTNHHSLLRLMEELVNLIDNHTEFFRGYLESLPKTERRVFLAVIDLWQPSSSAEIAARSRFDVRVVSTMLKRLIDRGAVVSDFFNGRRRYAAAERLFSIYYKLRRERDEAAIVQSLIHFMDVFYSDAELAELRTEIIAETERQPAVRNAIQRVLEDLSLGELSPVHNLQSKLISTRSKVSHAGQTLKSKNELEAEELLKEAMPHLSAVMEGDRSKLEAALASLDKIPRRFEKSDSPTILIEVANAIFLKGLLQLDAVGGKAASETLDEFIERFRKSESSEIQSNVAMALAAKGFTQIQALDFVSAIATCNQLVERFGKHEAHDIRISVALSLLTKGLMQAILGDFDLAIATWKHAVKHSGDADSREMKAVTAIALTAQGAFRGLVGDNYLAVLSFNELSFRFERETAIELKALLLVAQSAKEFIQGNIDAFTAIIMVCDKVVELLEEEDDLKLRGLTPAVECIHQILKEKPGQSEIVAEMFDNIHVILGKFGNAPSLDALFAMMLFVWGATQSDNSEPHNAIAAWNLLIERYAECEYQDVQELVANAIILSGARQVESRQTGEALRSFEKLSRILNRSTDPNMNVFGWHMGWLKAKAHLLHNESPAALEALMSAYSAFVASDEGMFRQMLAEIPELIAAGMSEHDILKVLASDDEKSEALLPLVAALRERSGESVRAPVEVMEVAADIRGQIVRIADAE